MLELQHLEAYDRDNADMSSATSFRHKHAGEGDIRRFEFGLRSDDDSGNRISNLNSGQTNVVCKWPNAGPLKSVLNGTVPMLDDNLVLIPSYSTTTGVGSNKTGEVGSSSSWCSEFVGFDYKAIDKSSARSNVATVRVNRASTDASPLWARWPPLRRANKTTATEPSSLLFTTIAVFNASEKPLWPIPRYYWQDITPDLATNRSIEGKDLNGLCGGGATLSTAPRGTVSKVLNYKRSDMRQSLDIVAVRRMDNAQRCVIMDVEEAKADIVFVQQERPHSLEEQPHHVSDSTSKSLTSAAASVPPTKEGEIRIRPSDPRSSDKRLTPIDVFASVSTRVGSSRFVDFAEPLALTTELELEQATKTGFGEMHLEYTPLIFRHRPTIDSALPLIHWIVTEKPKNGSQGCDLCLHDKIINRCLRKGDIVRRESDLAVGRWNGMMGVGDVAFVSSKRFCFEAHLAPFVGLNERKIGPVRRIRLDATHQVKDTKVYQCRVEFTRREAEEGIVFSPFACLRNAWDDVGIRRTDIHEENVVRKAQSRGRQLESSSSEGVSVAKVFGSLANWTFLESSATVQNAVFLFSALRQGYVTYPVSPLVNLTAERRTARRLDGKNVLRKMLDVPRAEWEQLLASKLPLEEISTTLSSRAVLMWRPSFYSPQTFQREVLSLRSPEGVIVNINLMRQSNGVPLIYRANKHDCEEGNGGELKNKNLIDLAAGYKLHVTAGSDPVELWFRLVQEHDFDVLSMHVSNALPRHGHFEEGSLAQFATGRRNNCVRFVYHPPSEAEMKGKKRQLAMTWLTALDGSTEFWDQFALRITIDRPSFVSRIAKAILPRGRKHLADVLFPLLVVVVIMVLIGVLLVKAKICHYLVPSLWMKRRRQHATRRRGGATRVSTHDDDDDELDAANEPHRATSEEVGHV